MSKETKQSIVFKLQQNASNLGLNADLLDGLSSSAFVQADGTIPLSANWDVGAFAVRALTFQSDVATGTAPLTVASTTKVTNLNADLLDDLSSAAFIQAGGSIGLSADWDAGSYEIRAQTFESDVTTGTAPLTVASTTVVTNLNADLLDGAHGSTYQSKIVATNLGVVGTGVTAVEYGDAYHHTTVLTVSQTNAAGLVTGDNVALASGYLLYTFPAGAIVVHNAYMSMGITATVEQAADTPDVGLGTTIGVGAVATLDTNPGFENILTGKTATNSSGTATVGQDICNSTGATGGLNIGAGNPHTVYFNIADTWADDTSADLSVDIAGTVVINWTFLA